MDPDVGSNDDAMKTLPDGRLRVLMAAVLTSARNRLPGAVGTGPRVSSEYA
jgi:hypothetical protein